MGDGQRDRTDLSEDRAWLDAFRRGDRDSLERVFRSYAPYVWTIIRGGVRTGDDGRLLGVHDPDEQDDLLQEVFVRALAPEMRDRYDGLRPYAPFLGSIARHVVLDHARRKSRWRSRARSLDNGTLQIDEWRPGEPLADEALVAEEERVAVAAFLETLDPPDRALVELRFQDGVSQRDAAERLGVGRQRVRTLEERIRDRFRRFLQLRDL